MTSAPFIIAVDGGGTSCRVRLARIDGTVMAEAMGGSANINSDYPGALACLRDTIAQAMRDAGTTDQIPAAAHLGLAGANASGRADDVGRDLDLPHACVTSDREPTLQGAFSGRDGTVALFGTGSFFAARRDGQINHLGGWGLTLGDVGGGAWLGREALRHTLRAHDGQRAHSDLTRALLAAHDGSAARIVTAATDAAPAYFARFAPDIVAAATKGDALGLELIAGSISELNSALAILDPESVAPVALLGGLGTQLGPFMPAQIAARLRTPMGTPLDGATALAIQAAKHAP